MFIQMSFSCVFRDVKVKAGEWFFEERAKKYPDEGNHWNNPCCAICSPHLSETQNVVCRCILVLQTFGGRSLRHYLALFVYTLNEA